MPVFSISGLASGLDVDNIIQQLMDLERVPKTRLEAKKQAVESKANVWKDVNTRLYNLQTKAQDLKSVTTFNAKKANSTDLAVADVTASSTALAGTYDLKVDRLAQSHSFASGTFSSANAALGFSGAVLINGKTLNIASTDTLNSIRDLINGTQDIYAKASVIQIGTDRYRLVVNSTKTGAQSLIPLTDDGTGSASTGVTSSDGTKVTASLTGSAEAGVYDVKVNQMATKHRVASDGEDTGAPAPTYSGSFTINGVTVSATNNTRTDIATLINNANAGVTASTETYTVGPTTYRRLVIESKSTGSAAAIKFTDASNILRDMGVLNPDLSVKNLQVGALDSKVLVNGVEFVRSSNTVTDVIDGLTLNYVATGTSTITVTTSGGVLRGLGILNAAGSLANELAAAQDAQFSVNGLSVSRSSNTASDVVDGLTLTVKRAGTSTITVSKDNQKFIDSVKAFVDQYNSTSDYLKTQTAWDAKTKKGGALMGDGTIMQVRSELRRAVTSVVPGLPTTFNSPTHVGLTTGKYDSPDKDRLLFDSAKLSEQLDKDPEGVAKLFGALLINAGLATNGGTASAPNGTAGGSYAVADVINGETSGARFGTTGGGWQGLIVPSEASPDYLEITFSGAKTIDQVKVHMLDTTDQKAIDHALRKFDIEYWTGSEWKAVANIKDNTLGVLSQEFNPVIASKIRLKITATNGASNPAKVLEVEAFQKNEGVGARVYTYARGYTLSGTGILAEKQKSLDKQIKVLNDQIDRFEERLEFKEAALKRQFTALERTLSKLKNQGSAISGQLAQLSTFNWGGS